MAIITFQHRISAFSFSQNLLYLVLSVFLIFLLDFSTANSLSELETDIKVFKETLLKILDEDEIIEELCLTKWTDPSVL